MVSQVQAREPAAPRAGPGAADGVPGGRGRDRRGRGQGDQGQRHSHMQGRGHPHSHHRMGEYITVESKAIFAEQCTRLLLQYYVADSLFLISWGFLPPKIARLNLRAFSSSSFVPFPSSFWQFQESIIPFLLFFLRS